jgi:hypothetical protein
MGAARTKLNYAIQRRLSCQRDQSTTNGYPSQRIQAVRNKIAYGREEEQRQNVAQAPQLLQSDM